MRVEILEYGGFKLRGMYHIKKKHGDRRVVAICYSAYDAQTVRRAINLDDVMTGKLRDKLKKKL